MTVRKAEETVKTVDVVQEKGLELSKKLLETALTSNSLNENQINNVKLAIDLYNTFKG